MRYNHRYHSALTEHHKRRRFRLTSLLYLGLLIIVLAGVFRTPIDASQLLGGFLLSLWRVSGAYLAALFLALLFGLVTLFSAKTEGLLLPIMDLAQSFPTFALLPILVFYFGKTSISVMAILVIAMVWPIMFAVINGIKEQRQDQSEAAVIFGATGWRYLLYYRLPMLKPSVVTGSIVSWGQAWDTIVGAEIIAGVAGAGHYLGTLGQVGHTQLLALGVSIYLFLIFSINQLLWLPLLHRFSKYRSES